MILRPALTALTLATSVALTSCGGGDDASAGGCTTDLQVTYPDSQVVSLDRAAAVRLADGGAYTVYVGDYEIPTTDIATSTVMPPTGSHQATVYLTPIGSLSGAAPITAGTTVAYTTTPDVLTFSAVLLSEDGLANQASNGTGSMTVESVEDTFCATIDYTDDQKRITGKIGAAVFASPF